MKGYEYHEKRIIKLFEANEIRFEFVVQGDPSSFNKELLDKYFTPEVRGKVSTGVLSCTLNHILSYELIAERQNKFALVFENDPFFLGNFSSRLNKLFPEILNLEEGFIISLENSTMRFPSFFQTKRRKHLYRADSGRMAGAYLINLQAAQNILKDLKTHKCNDVIDWWHNDLIDRNIIKMYWAHPPLTEQGSHNGRLSAGISSRPQSMTRRISWSIAKLYKTTINRLIHQKRLIPDG